MSGVLTDIAPVITASMRDRNTLSASFFAREADRLADVSLRMAERFNQGGRLLAFGHGAAASDAQHIAVEFVHPVLVGKPALPALDISSAVDALPTLVRPQDIVVSLSPADPRAAAALQGATSRGALTLALGGPGGLLSVAAPSPDPFICQEVIEIVYHVLWESVHVFLERAVAPQGSPAAASFLYPFLGETPSDRGAALAEVSTSIRSKAETVARLRTQAAAEQSAAIGRAAIALHERVIAGGTIFCLGNGGSATDATDLAWDLATPPKGYAGVRAVSLATDPAVVTALANDVGVEALFTRQLIAHGGPRDAVVAISTSGTSRNILAALNTARGAGMLTVALVGYDGGDIVRHALADYAIVVNHDQIPRIQEVQASIYHVLVELLHAFRVSRD